MSPGRIAVSQLHPACFDQRSAGAMAMSNTVAIPSGMLMRS